MHHEHKLKIFTCKASKDFAVKVAKALNVEVGDSDVLTFSDGEFQRSDRIHRTVDIPAC